jgi:hypothetical protein
LGIDGNVWVPVGDMGGVNAIARVTPGGTTTLVTTGLNAGALFGDGSDIIAGPDGNLWTTDLGTPMAIVRADVQLPPLATTGVASAVTSTAATVAGTANPRGNATSVVVDWGTTPALGTKVAAGTLGISDQVSPVSTALSGLPAGTTIDYRVEATNAYGTVAGPTQTFTTVKGAAPTPTAKSTSRSVTIGDQKVTITAGVAHDACVAHGGSLAVSISAKHASGTHLTFRRASLFLDRGVAHKRHRTVKGKRRTITVHLANATVHHLPAHRSLSLHKAKSGTHAVHVRFTYTHTVRRHGKRHTITTRKAVTLHFRVC